MVSLGGKPYYEILGCSNCLISDFVFKILDSPTLSSKLF